MSFVEYGPECQFPIQNIPFGAFMHPSGEAHCATAIGDQVVDLHILQESGLLSDAGLPAGVFKGQLNAFMELGKPAWVKTREVLQRLLAKDSSLASHAAREKVFIPMSDVQMILPARIGDYTDFYASKEHASNLGKMLRPGQPPLLPNWTHLPVGYHGRASSVVVSGQPIRRPRGQTKADDADAPSFTACRLMDFELEMGFFVGTGNNLGDPVKIGEAGDKLFGMVLLNDWSARDIQKWEYVPLGPFGAKNFGSTISPWIITMEALAPFRCAPPAQDPAPLPYLKQEGNTAIDVQLEVLIQSEKMASPASVVKSNLKYMYWSGEQMLTHHSVTGCNMASGDLLGTGTISGPEDMYGSMIEASWRGSRVVKVGDEERKFLQDGDTVFMTGFCQGPDYRIGFGQCEGKILPAHPLDQI